MGCPGQCPILCRLSCFRVLTRLLWFAGREAEGETVCASGSAQWADLPHHRSPGGLRIFE